MELQELKDTWSSLDERLKKNELLKERIIREMITSKVSKSTNRLIYIEVITLVGLMLYLSFIIYLLCESGGKVLLWDMMFGYSALLIIIYLPWAVYKIYGLMKFDLSDSIGENIYRINKYNMDISREKIIFVYAFAILLITMSLFFIQANAEIYRWAFFICVAILAILYIQWGYKMIKKKLDTIKKSLEELKELEEDNEI